MPCHPALPIPVLAITLQLLSMAKDSAQPTCYLEVECLLQSTPEDTLPSHP
ncbi:hypothetical protein XENTR_v10022219 [Xenopus tropicalis]|nr:hypothetical protein XENTR_v10022219 [Xenopus tropicalis]